MYNEGLNSSFAQFMEEKVKYHLYISVGEVLVSPLFNATTTDTNYTVRPLFNFNNVTSSNPNDHTENKDVLILEKDTSTLLYFKADVNVMTVSEFSNETTIDDIKYTLYYTYDSITGEPAPHRMTSCGASTDENGYYLDSVVVE
jgi:hypothetical protein